jgi:hypothetical protein
VGGRPPQPTTAFDCLAQPPPASLERAHRAPAAADTDGSTQDHGHGRSHRGSHGDFARTGARVGATFLGVSATQWGCRL